MGTRFALIFVLAISVLLIASCGGSDRGTGPESPAPAGSTFLASLAPAGSTFIAEVRIADILADADFQALYEELPKNDDDPQTLDGLLDQAIDEIGIDLRQFSGLLIFGDISQLSEESPLVGLISQGSFDESNLVQAIERANEVSLTSTEYKGRRIYSYEEEGVDLAVIGDDTLAFGTPEAVRLVIDVQEGDADPLSGKLYDTFNELGDVMLRLALEVPSQGIEQLAGSSGSPTTGPADRSVPEDPGIVSFAIDKDGERISFEVRGDISIGLLGGLGEFTGLFLN